MPRPLMMDSVQALLPDNTTVDEVVVVQERSGWFLWAGIAVFIAVWLLGQQFDWGPLVAGGLAGGALGAVFAIGARTYLLARAGDQVLLFRSSKMRAKAVELIEEFPPETNLRQVGRMINDSYMLGGRKIVVSKMFRERLGRILPISGG